MNNEFLKGNYKLKKDIKEKKLHINEKDKLKKEMTDKALASVGGSMVYVEKDILFWDGSEKVEDSEEK